MSNEDRSRRQAQGKRAAGRVATLAAGLLLIAAAPASAADYQTNLGPMPLDDETKLLVQGRGDATASFDGKLLTIRGTFHGLPSKATEAAIYLSAFTGGPGAKVQTLTVSPATEGTIAGSLKLTAAQATALRTGRLYIQLNSEKAPPGYPWGAYGNLWGWLMAAHPTAGQSEPQQGKWFIPQLDMPSR